MLKGPLLKLVVVGVAAVLLCYADVRYGCVSAGDEADLMQPALKRRALKLTRTDDSLPPRGAIVWFEHPDAAAEGFASRIVALPGDRVALREGALVLNGVEVREPYARGGRDTLLDVRVPVGHVFVLNDVRAARRSAARDSRGLGPVPLVAVLGWAGDRIAEGALAAAGAADGDVP